MDCEAAHTFDHRAIGDCRYAGDVIGDPTLERLDNPWRQKVAAARLRYETDPSDKNRREYLRVLKIFADLVMRHEVPEERL